MADEVCFPASRPPQALVDAAIATSREHGDSARAIGAAGESTRQRVADQIKTGGKLDAESVRPPDRGVAAPSKGLTKNR